MHSVEIHVSTMEISTVWKYTCKHNGNKHSVKISACVKLPRFLDCVLRRGNTYMYMLHVHVHVHVCIYMCVKEKVRLYSSYM